MKLIGLCLIFALPATSLADTSIEEIKCTIERISVDDSAFTGGTTFFNLELREDEDESLVGTKTVQNKLAPSYKTTYSKVASGRSNTVELKTILDDKVVAISSINPNPHDVIKNSFVTRNGDFQFHITCTTKL